MNTGLRFIEWYQIEGRRLDTGSPEYKISHEDAVRRPNAVDASAVARWLEKTTERHIVNPNDFQGPADWTESQFYEFWARIINRFIDHMVFIDGWQFSYGCTREFITALACNIPCSDQKNEPISREQGLSIIAAARDKLADHESYGRRVA